MSTPYLCEIRIVSFNFPPRGWALCNGQLLPLNQNQAIFAIIGTTYGGDGRVNFALPNLQGRVPLHTGGGFTLGQPGGQETHTLTNPEASHSHGAMANATTTDQASPAGHFWANAALSNYSTTAGSAMAPSGPNGGSQGHENRSPFLTLNFIIALVGIFPSRN